MPCWFASLALIIDTKREKTHVPPSQDPSPRIPRIFRPHIPRILRPRRERPNYLREIILSGEIARMRQQNRFYNQSTKEWHSLWNKTAICFLGMNAIYLSIRWRINIPQSFPDSRGIVLEHHFIFAKKLSANRAPTRSRHLWSLDSTEIRPKNGPINLIPNTQSCDKNPARYRQLWSSNDIRSTNGPKNLTPNSESCSSQAIMILEWHPTK